MRLAYHKTVKRIRRKKWKIKFKNILKIKKMNLKF